ncbi:lob domain-containing protein 2 [Nicotiana attenuata]|uniref:Lob domain-containing protein 2 n=1 Tax=Nicotiana attenuata TaxID=49451 RepID=A0A1J6ITB1_NICAT|nr:lob domain-containing protein 2 [Nicotiana attenuata]
MPDNKNNNAEAGAAAVDAVESHEAVGSNRLACASCKHQRKKCIEGECVMWRHFPATKMDEFLGVHKVFGISNVTKKIKSLDDVAEQDEAIKSFFWEARLWQEDPVHGPLGEYKKLEQQLKELKEEKRNKELQIVQFPDVPRPPTPLEIRYMDQMVARRQISTISTLSDQEDYLLNSTAPNYSTLLQGHGAFPSHYNNPIEQRQLNSLIPRQVFQGVQFQQCPNRTLQAEGRGISHLATYNGHCQLHQQRCSYNNVDLGQGITRGRRRRKECSDHQLVSPSCSGRHVRGRGIGPVSTGAIISSCSSASFADQWTDNANKTMLRDSTGGRHCEVPIPLPSEVQHIAHGSNRRADDFQHHFTNNLPRESSQSDLESRDDSTSKRF